MWIEAFSPWIKQDEVNFFRFINEVRLENINPWKHAEKHLRECDQRLGTVIERARTCRLESGARGFLTLADSIISQQLLNLVAGIRPLDRSNVPHLCP